MAAVAVMVHQVAVQADSVAAVQVRQRLLREQQIQAAAAEVKQIQVAQVLTAVQVLLLLDTQFKEK